MRFAAELSCTLITAVVTLACGAPAPTPTKVTPAAAQDDPIAKQDEPDDVGVPTPDAAPRITADAAIHDFGAIKGTDAVEHVFEIRNAGNADLVIDHVQKT